MPAFVYTAKTDSAQTVVGEIIARTQDEAIELISQRGLLPVTLEEQFSKSSITKKVRQRVSTKELYVFSRHLMSLLKGGFPLLKALEIISGQTANSYFANLLSKICDEVRNGRSFSDSLADYPHVFSNVYVSMVRAGEESGRLVEVLSHLSQYQKDQDEINTKVKTALAYPLFMAVMGSLTIIFMLTFVLPKMAGLYQNMGNNLPLPTKMLLGISHFLREAWFFVLIGVLAIAAMVERWVKTEKGKVYLSQLENKIPFLGPFLLKIQLARFSRTMQVLLKSGISILKAIGLSIPVVRNDLLREELSVCKTTVTMGGSFADGLKKGQLTPSMMGHLVAVGEESGNLSDTFNEIANSYEQELNEQIKVITTLLEPIMILAIGLVVGFIVFAMLLPIFEISVI